MNLAKDALHVLGSVAPTLATAVAGPFGGMAVRVIEGALGFSSANANPDDQQKTIENALLGGDPQTLLAMKKAQNDFSAQMKQLDISEDKLAYDDAANARAREIAVRDNTPRVLAYLTTAGFFGALAAAFAWGVPEASKATVYSMIGSLGTVWITQMSYYFGSSRGSDDKTKVLAEIAKS